MADEAHELNNLEGALRALKPASPALERDRLMFEAGKAAGSGPGWLWPTATAAALLVALGLSATLFLREPPERVVYVKVSEPPPVPEPIAIEIEPTKPAPPTRLAYLSLRERVLRDGVDGLPPPTAVPSTKPPLTVKDLLQP